MSDGVFERLPNVAPEQYEAECDVRAARTEYIHGLQRIGLVNRQRWIDAGGCSKCGGMGRLTLHYSDGDEDGGPCPGYTADEHVYVSKDEPWPMFHVATEAPDLERDEIADNFRGHAWRFVRGVPCTAATVGRFNDHPEALTESERSILADLAESLAIAEETLRGATWRFTPHVGARVRGVRGRKVKPGSEGIIVWIGVGEAYSERYTRWRDKKGTVRVGMLVDGAEKATFTDASNVMVLAPAADIDLPELYGSEKQIAWARKLRLAALARGMSEDEARKQASARWWIDEHTKGEARPIARVAARAPETPLGQTGRLL